MLLDSELSNYSSTHKNYILRKRDNCMRPINVNKIIQKIQDSWRNTNIDPTVSRRNNQNPSDLISLHLFTLEFLGGQTKENNEKHTRGLSLSSGRQAMRRPRACCLGPGNEDDYYSYCPKNYVFIITVLWLLFYHCYYRCWLFRYPYEWCSNYHNASPCILDDVYNDAPRVEHWARNVKGASKLRRAGGLSPPAATQAWPASGAAFWT